MAIKIGDGCWLSLTGVLVMLLGFGLSFWAIARNDPRHYAIVRTYHSRLCVGPDSVMVLRPVNGAEPECPELTIDAEVDMVASVPINRPPSDDKLAEAGSERAYIVTLIGTAVSEPLVFHDYFWQTGETTPRHGPTGESTLPVPEDMRRRILPVLANEIADLAGTEIGDAVRAGGVAASSLPAITNRSNWPGLGWLAVTFIGIIMIRVGTWAPYPAQARPKPDSA